MRGLALLLFLTVACGDDEGGLDGSLPDAPRAGDGASGDGAPADGSAADGPPGDAGAVCTGPDDCPGAYCCETGSGPARCMTDFADCPIALCDDGPDCPGGACCPQGFCAEAGCD